MKLIFECGLRIVDWKEYQREKNERFGLYHSQSDRHRLPTLGMLALFGDGDILEGQTQSTLPPAIHTVASRGVTAHFGGENPPNDISLKLGVSVLWFTFEGEGIPYVFKPEGELFFSDWRFDLFSPDGAHSFCYRITRVPITSSPLIGSEPGRL